MNQRELPFWDTSDFVTYTEVEEYRTRVYPRRGPRLLAELRDYVIVYANEEDLSMLGRINILVVTLAALNPDWFDFSVEVFRTCILPSQTPPKLLHSLFETTVRQLAKKVA